MDPAGDIAVGVFGGSGFYKLLEDAEEIALDTPYGPPSARVRVGELNGARVAFMPRHGDQHQLPPHRVNYRANVWAMHKLGVRRILGPCACGSLNPEIPPGTFVVCDQFVDRTSGREDTFYDGPQTTHVAGAEPYCPDLRRTLCDAARAEGIEHRDGGTVVVIQGPRFSTAAESRWFATFADVVNMTQYPEAWLARELEICYATVALVTDWDAGVGGTEPVTAEAAIRAFDENLGRLRALLVRAASMIGPQPDDVCASALASAVIH